MTISKEEKILQLITSNNFKLKSEVYQKCMPKVIPRNLKTIRTVISPEKIG